MFGFLYVFQTTPSDARFRRYYIGSFLILLKEACRNIYIIQELKVSTPRNVLHYTHTDTYGV